MRRQNKTYKNNRYNRYKKYNTRRYKKKVKDIYGGDNKKKVGFKKAQCAPKENDELNKFTCYSKDDLIKMKDLWNARHRDMPISDTDPTDPDLQR